MLPIATALGRVMITLGSLDACCGRIDLDDLVFIFIDCPCLWYKVF